MARFYEIVMRGRTNAGSLVQTWWYRDPAAGVPNAGNLVDVANVADRDIVPKLQPLIPSQCAIDNLLVYGYDETFARQPYLPHTKPLAKAGTRVAAAHNPALCCIISLTIEPAAPGHQIDPQTGGLVLRPVRRGYIALGPLDNADVTNAGILSGTFQALAALAAYRTQLAAQLFDATTMATALDPVRVSRVPKGGTIRGFGYVRGTVLRTQASFRRSRLAGRGA
ncbi:MAG TPA: hypothetical protein VGW38_03185 [Chloroflexota bacterium]|nr:hypothetical protein [Chloroflexota bacterium]